MEHVMPDPMNREIREVVVKRLQALQDRQELTLEDVRYHADHVLELSERHLYRLVQRGTSEPQPRPARQLTEREKLAYFEASGRATLAFRTLQEEGSAECSLRTYQRAIKRTFNESERAFARSGERARRDRLGRAMRPLPSRN